MQHTGAKKVNTGAPVHLPLQHFQAVDLSLDLTLTPLGDKRRFDRRPVFFDAACKSYKFGDAVLFSRLQPIG